MDIQKMAAVIVAFVVVVGAIGGLSWVAIRGSRLLSERGQARLDQLLASLGGPGPAGPERTRIRFPVYVGTVFYVVEFQPEFYVARGKARQAVNALAAFSLKYGLLTGLAPYVLFMVLVNYVLQAPRLPRA